MVHGMEPCLVPGQWPKVIFNNNGLRDQLVQTLKAEEIPEWRYSKTADEFDLALVWAFLDTIGCQERIFASKDEFENILHCFRALGDCFMSQGSCSIVAAASEPAYWEFTSVVGRTVEARVRPIQDNIYEFDSEQEPTQYVIQSWEIETGSCRLSTPDGETTLEVQDIDLFNFLREGRVIELILN